MLDWLTSTFGAGKARLHASPLYDAIVTEARLPDHYRASGLPDTLEGRYEMLGLHLYAVLRHLRAVPDAAPLAQALTDQFADDMDSVLRELGTGDTAVPKRVRTLVAGFLGRQAAYDAALPGGDEALGAAIARVLPLPETDARIAGRTLANHVRAILVALERQPLDRLDAGEITFPKMAATADGH